MHISEIYFVWLLGLTVIETAILYIITILVNLNARLVLYVPIRRLHKVSALTNMHVKIHFEETAVSIKSIEVYNDDL